MNAPQLTQLAITEAVAEYDLSRGILLNLLSTGQLAGHKVRGHRGYEWRVAPADLDALGYRRRAAAPADTAELLRTIQRLRELVAHHCRRADQLDGRLGQVSMELAAVRAELGQATAPRVVHLDLAAIPQPRVEVDITTPARSGQRPRGR